MTILFNMVKQQKGFKEEQKHPLDLVNEGAADISGSEADIESDDDVSKAAKDVGLYQEADDEHPAEVGVAEEVEKDEQLHQEQD